MEEHRIPDPDSELLERKVLADARIQEILTETKDSDKSFAAYFHTLFSILTTEDAAEFYHAFGDGYADSFADPKSQAKETALPANCADALRLLVRECADCRTLAEHTTWMSGRKGVYAFGGDLIYKELALEVCNYVNEVLEDRPGAVDLISDAVILEMIASMHQSYVNEYIEYRYDRIFSTSEFEETPGFGLSAVTDGAELWDMMCSCPENFYCGFPFDPDAHTHVMQKIEEHPEEKYFIFGKNGGAAMAERFGIDLLGQIPLVQSIREAGDAGEPVALGTRPDSMAFLELARKLTEAVNKD